MASIIQELPAEVVHLITAGEVIDSLAAVVRELVENSLDAGATRVIVSLCPKQWRVSVADNGCGMCWENLQLAAVAHSTSKISECADLHKITSLGFRGEALHSLTNLGNLEIVSRSVNVDTGWRVTYGHGGRIINSEITAIAPGTVVTVSNLFGNWLQRRQSLPKLTQQIKAVQLTIQQIALCHPEITWQVKQDERPWFAISSTTSTGKVIPQILHQVRSGDLQELQIEVPNPQNSESLESEPLEPKHQNSHITEQVTPLTPDYLTRQQNKVKPQSEIQTAKLSSRLYLAVGLPDRCHRHRPDWIRVAVNGRIVKSPELEKAILGSFRKTLPRDRYPICFLHASITPDQVDWNRNPAKTHIYLKRIEYWQDVIQQAIHQVLQINSDTINQVVQTKRVTKLIKAAEEKNPYNFDSNLSNNQNKHHNYLQLKAVAQINKTYIVAEHPGGMWLIEQHIAHERIIYEQLCDRWRLIPLEPAIILHQLSTVQINQLQHIGIEIEPFGEQLWAVRNIPASLKDREDRAEALLELSFGGDLQAAQVAVACRTAIRNGTSLSLREMQTILDQWQKTRNPRTCPHGRPICLSLEESSLSRYFRRHWVIGKSHGI
ncbi:MAG: DNA mismatch repair endonuclease MutL [Mastigocoleus sp.]